MQSIQTVSENTIYVGASDRRLAKFENLFPIPRGVSYNAYVILDEKTALLDTADASVGAQFLENVAAALDGRKLDYLIVDHICLLYTSPPERFAIIVFSRPPRSTASMAWATAALISVRVASRAMRSLAV